MTNFVFVYVSVFTVNNCPTGLGFMPVDATGDGTTTWIEPTATSTNGGVTLLSQTHTPGVSTFTFNTLTAVTYRWQDSANEQATCNFYINLQTAGKKKVNNITERHKLMCLMPN